MTEMSAPERATAARFESAEPAPESWGGGLREAIRDALAVPGVGIFAQWEQERRILALPELAALRAKADAADRVRAEVAAWDDAAREWYYAHRHDTSGTTYACGFEDGWDHADQLVRRALDGPPC